MPSEADADGPTQSGQTPQAAAERGEAGGRLPTLTPAPDAPAAIRDGAAHFNARRYFDAHEAWEARWLTLRPGPIREATQALVQIAVALEHHRRGNAAGARRTLQRATARLLAAGDAATGLHGIDVAALMREVERAVRPDV